MRRWRSLVLLLGACGGGASGPADGGSDACPEGLEQVGPACAPIFDDCGDNEISLLGGGCQRVGLPADCWDGWLPTDDGGCDPILPDHDCPDGMMEIIGQTDCQPVSDCGTGRWGNIDIQPGAVFVDASYVGVSTGSQAQPFTDIQTAVDAVPACGQVVVATGEYVGDVIIDKDLRLDGHCPRMVTIRGVSDAWPALYLAEDRSIEVRGVRVTGPFVGILGYYSRVALLEQVEVVDTGLTGTEFDGVAEATLRRSRIARAHAAGVLVEWGSIATIEDLVVRDTSAHETRGFGEGLGEELGSDLHLRRGLIASNQAAGAYVFGSAATLEEVVVRDTRADPQGLLGLGIELRWGDNAPSDVELSRSLVAANHHSGVLIHGASVTLDEVVVRDTRPEPASGTFGRGIAVNDDTDFPGASSLDLRNSLLIGNTNQGLVAFGSTVTVKDSVVRDTLSGAYPSRGIGIQHHPVTLAPSDLELLGTLLAGNESGLIGFSSTVRIEDVVVRDSSATAELPEVGIGVADPLSLQSSVSVRRTFLNRTHSTGVYLDVPEANVEDVAIRATGPAPDGSYGDGIFVTTEFGPAHVGLRRVLVEGGARAGVIYDGGGGSISGSVIRDNVFAVDLEQSANPVIGDDNVFQDNERNKVTSGEGLEPSPPLEPLDF